MLTIKETSYNVSCSSSKSLVSNTNSKFKHSLLSYISSQIKINYNPSSFSFITTHNTLVNANYFHVDILSTIMSTTNIEILLSYLNSPSKGICDYIINKLFQNFIYESLQYLPQLLSLYISNNKNNKHLKKFFLYCCGECIKYSIITTWMINAFADGNTHKQIFKLSEQIENSLVNKFHAYNNTFSISHNKECDDKLFSQSLSKQNKLNYHYEVMKFYSELKTLCEELKCVPKGKCSFHNKDKLLKEKLYCINHKINNLYLNYFDDNIETNEQSKCIFRGIVLPISDDYIEDEKCFIIIRILPEYSSCFTTKERVLIKIVCECIRIEDCDKWKELHNEYNTKLNENDITENSKTNNEFTLVDNSVINDNYNFSKEASTLLSHDNMHPTHLSFSYSSSTYINKPFLLSSRSSYTSDAITFNSISISNDFNPFDSNWSTIISDIKSTSPYRNFPSHSIKAFLVKSNDDLRQEHFCMQLIKLFHEIFSLRTGLYLTPYSIQITSSSSGLIEYIPNTISFDCLKRKLHKQTFSSFFKHFFKPNLHKALINFAGSLAAYSLICYFLQIKDRHNGNILLDINGKIIHIDFGFILGISPGNNFQFENAPFKFTKDYSDVLGGVDSVYFKYFKLKFVEGFSVARKYYERFQSVIKGMMGAQLGMRCFEGRDLKKILKEFRMRFLLDVRKKEFIMKVENIIDEAMKNKRTRQYDLYQYLMNGIYY